MTENSGTPAAATERHSITEYLSNLLGSGENPCRRRTPARACTLAIPQARLGHWHDTLVRPHTQSMYQIAFPGEMLAAFVPWLMLNRDG